MVGISMMKATEIIESLINVRKYKDALKTAVELGNFKMSECNIRLINAIIFENMEQREDGVGIFLSREL